jgi:hypothetical protein
MEYLTGPVGGMPYGSDFSREFHESFHGKSFTEVCPRSFYTIIILYFYGIVYGFYGAFHK